MRRVVLDASAFLAWFSGQGRGVRAEYESGSLQVQVPGAFTLAVLQAAHEQGQLTPGALARLATEIDHLRFEVREPPAAVVAEWLAKGLDPARASCAALAASSDLPLLTADEELLRTARTVARGPDRW